MQKKNNYRYIDIYGKELIISKAKNGNVNFVLYHNKIVEGTTRQEFKNLSIIISKQTEPIYNLVEGIYNYTMGQIIVSENPICDGRNFMFLAKEKDDYNFIINHDLANELRNPFETKIEVSNKFINDLYDEHLYEKTLVKNYK